MSTSIHNPIARLTSHRHSYQETEPQAGPILVLGRPATDLPGVLCHDNPHAPAAMIALAGRVDPAALAAVLQVADDPALPVADFAGNTDSCSDIQLDSFTAQTCIEAWARLGPLRRRLADIPFRASRQERDELTALRLAWSRDVPIEASYAPDAKTLIDYRLLGSSTGNRERLERLVALEALQRRHFARTPLCVRCASARMLASETCPGCGGADLADEKVVHHYRCGWQGPETQFMRGRQLVCPKCRRELRHFGMDYGKPGVIVHCRSCGGTNPDPDLRYACLDCSTVMPSEKTPSTDWYHYDLTDTGLRALRNGRLQARAMETAFGPRTAALPLAEFRLLAGAAQRSARRFGRDFCVVELASPDLVALRAEVGAAEVDAGLQHAVVVIMDCVTDCELVAVGEDSSLLIGFPETSAAEAAAIANRLCAAIAAEVGLPLNLLATMHEGDMVSEVLGR